jgi:hypothetical protein
MMFSQVIFIVNAHKDGCDVSFMAFLKQVERCFEGLIGNLNLQVMEEQSRPATSIPMTTNSSMSGAEFVDEGMPDSVFDFILPRFLSIIFIIMCLILLNLLVAMMGDTYTRISEDAKGEWLMQRAQIIFSIEQNMSTEDLKNEKYKYWVDVADTAGQKKRFLQVEEEHEDAFKEFVTTELMLEKKKKAEQVTEEEKRKAEEREHLERSRKVKEEVVPKAFNQWKNQASVPFDKTNESGTTATGFGVKPGITTLERSLQNVVVETVEEQHTYGNKLNDGVRNLRHSPSGGGMPSASEMPSVTFGGVGGSSLNEDDRELISRVETKLDELTKLTKALPDLIRAQVVSAVGSLPAPTFDSATLAALPPSQAATPAHGRADLELFKEVRRNHDKLETKLEVFQATATNLMMKNCELEGQVQALRHTIGQAH